MQIKSIFPFKKISEGSSFVSGYAFKSKDFSDSGIPVIKIKNIQNKKVVYLKDQFYPESLFNQRLEKFKVKRNDVLIAMTGQGSVGRVGQVKETQDSFGLLNQRVGKIICDEINLNRDYLFYVISSKMYEDFLFNKAIGSGQPNLSPSDIIEVKIPFPPLPEQTQIANILSAIADKIENNLATNKTLEDMAMALYKHWFVDFCPFKDGEFIDSELGPIPKGWEVKRLDDLANILNSKRVPLSTGQRSKRKGRYSYYGASGVIDNIDDYIFDGEYVIISEDGENLRSRKTPIGFSAIGKFWVNNHAHILEGKQNGINKLIICHIAQMDMNPYLTGAVQPKLNKSNLLSIGIAMPNEDLIIQEVLDEFYSISRLNFSNEKEVENLTKLRDTLLPKLISGEIRLKEFREEVETIL